MSPLKPGFRFSVGDAVITLVATLLTALSWRVMGSFSMIFVIVLFHFFLFCNVFRIRRRYELIWAGIFVVSVLLCSVFEIWNWWLIVASQSPVTVLVILLEFRSDRYHGVGYTLKHRQATTLATSSK